MFPTEEQDSQKLKKSIDFLKKLLVQMTGVPSILVVEDNDIDTMLFKRELRKFACNATFCADGEDAVNHIKSKKFDLIFLDQVVPKLNGSEILQQTAGFREGARVIIVTGHIDSPHIPKILDSGAIMAFAKPLTEENLSLFLTRI